MTTKSWLKNLQTRLEDVPPAPLNNLKDPRPFEKIVGEMPDDVRRLWAMSDALADRASSIAAEANKAHDEHGDSCNDACHEAARRISAIANEKQTLESVIWTSIRDHFDLWNVTIGVRKGGQVVSWDPQDDPEAVPRMSAVMVRFG